MQAGRCALNLPAAAIRAVWAAAALLLLAGAWLQASGLNPPLLAALQAHTPAAPVLWSSLSVLGLGWSAWIVVAALDRRSGRARALLLPGLLIGSALTHALKWLFATARPAAALPASGLQLVGEPIYGGGAMPSGHALAAFAVLALLGLAWPRRRWWWPLGLGVALLVAWSRIAVGAHWPADLLVGAGLGLLTALLSRQLMQHADGLQRWWADAAGQRATGVAELLAGLAMMLTRTGYPQGRGMQAALVLLALASGLQRLGVWRRLLLLSRSALQRWTRMAA